MTGPITRLRDAVSIVTYLALIGYVVANQKLHHINRNRNKCHSTTKFPETWQNSRIIKRKKSSRFPGYSGFPGVLDTLHKQWC